MAVTQLRPTPPRRTPEREALAEALKRHAAALDQVSRVEQAHEHATEVVYRAAAALKTADAALVEARANEPARLAAVALNEDGGTISVADAELAATTAANDLAGARRTRDALSERTQRQAAEVARTQRAIDDAVAGVVKVEMQVTALLKEAEAAQADLINHRIVLRHLLHAGWVAEPEAAAVKSFLFQYGDQLPGTFLNLISQDWDHHPAAAVWHAASEELKRNADASLPSS